MIRYWDRVSVCLSVRLSVCLWRAWAVHKQRTLLPATPRSGRVTVAGNVLTLGSWERCMGSVCLSVCLCVCLSVCVCAWQVCHALHHLVQNLLTPPGRPGMWLGCEKTVRKYSYRFPMGLLCKMGILKIAILRNISHYRGYYTSHGHSNTNRNS